MKLALGIVIGPLGLALGLAPLACGSADDGSGSRDEDYTIHPDGSDLPGKLLVMAPTVPAGATIEATTIHRAASHVDLGQPLGPMGVGDQTFGMQTHGVWINMSNSSGTANIVSNQTTTLTTALLGVQATGGPRTVGLAQAVSRVGITLNPKSGNNGWVNAASDGSKVVPLLAGDYEVNFGLHDGVPVTLASGDAKVVTAYDTSSRRVTRLKAPARDLPDATCGNGNGHGWRIVDKRNTSSWQDFVLEAGEEIDVGVSPRKEGASYMLTAPSWWVTNVDIPLGERGAGPRKWELGRIDVDDVSINGGPTLVRGTYTIRTADANGQAVGPTLMRCSPPTHSGVDVPPGHYRVEIKYHTVESGNKVDVHVIDVP